MKKYMYMSLATALVSVFALCFTACDDDEKDMTRPVITDTGIVANPINCQVYHRGEVIPFRYVFTDNVELGNYNIEIHSNHDHHTHSTEAEDCPEHEGEGHEDAEPVNPWVFNKSYAIPAGKTVYEADLKIPIPADIDPGEYHFMIRVTDAAGWQQLRSVSIHIEE